MKTIKMSKMTAEEFIRSLHEQCGGEVQLACWYWLHAHPTKEELDRLTQSSPMRRAK
jgi:hypothetical protein